MKSSNPVFKSKYFNNLPNTYQSTSIMTIEGTINKTLIMFFILIATAGYTWTKFMEAWDFSSVIPLLMIGLVGGLITGLIASFRPQGARITAPLYAAFEGLLLGGLSAMFETMYPGIVFRAVLLTFGTLGIMLFLYRSGTIRATGKFRVAVMAATGGIALVYLFSWIMRLFGFQMMGIYGNSLIGIGFSLVVVGIAALNLILDFDFIENGSRQNLPAFMEWYSAFGLIVTLIWLYIELLRLLSKLYSRR